MKNRYTLVASLLLTVTALQAQTFEWARSFAGFNSREGSSMAIDVSGNIYKTGDFEGVLYFDPGSDIAGNTSTEFLEDMDEEDSSIDSDPQTDKFFLISTGQDDIFVQKLDKNGNLIWARSFGGAYMDFGYSIAVDHSGNVYTTGRFNGTVDFDPSSHSTYLTSAGYEDFFIQKMDSNGSFLWAKSFGGISSDVAISIAVDHQENIYTAGTFNKKVDFDPGSDTSFLTSVGRSDVFIQKMDANGNFIWAKSIQNRTYRGMYCYSLTLDSSGNVYTTGYFESTVDFDPGSDTFYLISEGYADVFILKMDRNGSFVWAKSFGGTGRSYSQCDYGHSIAVDHSGNVYTTGGYYKTVDFDPGPDTSYLTSSKRISSFVQKMDSNGHFLWVKSFGGTGNSSITIDLAGYIYRVGSFYETVDFDPGPDSTYLISNGSADVFVQKMDKNGNLLWAESFGGAADDRGHSVIIDDSENLYITGCFDGTVDFDPGSDSTTLTSDRHFDAFIQKMSQ